MRTNQLLATSAFSHFLAIPADTATKGAAIEGSIEEGSDNKTPGIGDNKGPILENYIPVLESKEIAAVEVKKFAATLQKSANKFGSQWEQFALIVTDYLYFFVQGTKLVPELRAFETAIRELITGKKVKVGKPTKTKSQREQEALAKANDPKKNWSNETKKLLGQVEAASEVTSMGFKSFDQAIKPACMAAFLVLFGVQESIKDTKIGPTTYQKVRRYLNHPKQPIVNIHGVTTKGGKEVPTYLGDTAKPIDTSDADLWPDDTYEGIGFNDHALHPMVPTGEGEVDLHDKEGNPVIGKDGKQVTVMKATFRSKINHPDFKDKPLIGMTRESVDRDYKRFFVSKPVILKSDQKADIEAALNQDKVVLLAETGLPVPAKREVAGTTGSASTSNIKIVQIKDATRMDILNAALAALRGMRGKKEAQFTEEERDVIAGINSEAATFTEEWGDGEEPAETDEMVDTVMTGTNG